MRQRAFGRAGFAVSELCLGTWGLSGDGYGPTTEAQAERVVDRAIELGIDLFETADVYGRGSMERLLGLRLDAKTTRVITKLGTFRSDARDGPEPPAEKHFDAESLRRAFDASRDRLRREKIDVVLLHNPDARALAERDGPNLLKQLVDEGLVGSWGVAAGSVAVARAAIAQEADVVQLAYNPFVAHDLHVLSDDLLDGRVALLARSVLAHGLLTGHWGPDRTFEPDDHRARRWSQAALQRRLRQLDALRPLVGGDVLSLRAAALRFALSNAVVTSVVLGPRTRRQLDTLVREAGSGPPYLLDTQLAQLPIRLKRFGVLP